MLLTALAVLDTPIWLLISTSLAGAAGSLAIAFRMFNRRDQHTIDLLNSAIDKNVAPRFADRTLVVTRTGDEADGSLKIASFVNAWLATSLRETALVRGALTWAERAFADPVFELTKAFDNIDNFREVSELFMRRERLALYHWNKRHTLSYQAYELLRIAFANRIGVIEDLIAIGCASLILKSIQFAFGTKSGFVSVAALVTSSETPPGFWTHFQSIASVQPGDTLLSHSQIYEDSAVQAEIAQWLATQFEGKIESAINANLQCRDRLV